jgi:hypothetical protein
VIKGSPKAPADDVIPVQSDDRRALEEPRDRLPARPQIGTMSLLLAADMRVALPLQDKPYLHGPRERALLVRTKILHYRLSYGGTTPQTTGAVS